MKHLIPLSWSMSNYISYCDSIMMIPNNIVVQLYYEETGKKVFSCSQLGDLVRNSYLYYLKPHQLTDITLLGYSSYNNKK